MRAEPTYEEMVQKRAQEWRAAQAKASAQLDEVHAGLARMPDVKDAPSPDEPWGHPGIVCGCGCEVFHVQRWTTVNGRRHRAELACMSCKRVDTWDWSEARWLR